MLNIFFLKSEKVARASTRKAILLQEMQYIFGHSGYWRNHSRTLLFRLVPTPHPAHYRQATLL